MVSSPRSVFEYFCIIVYIDTEIVKPWIHKYRLKLDTVFLNPVLDKVSMRR